MQFGRTPVRPPRRLDASAEVGELVVWDMHSEGADRRASCRSGYTEWKEVGARCSNTRRGRGQ
jgi:hypothetical protein